MDITQTIFIAFIQGLTEFLPISSSAHLILVPKLLEWQDQGLVFDIAVHLGTLVAVVWYFRQDISALIVDFFASIRHQKTIGQSKMAWGVLLATIPVGLAGLLFKDIIASDLRSITVIAYATLGFGVLLGIADYISRNNSNVRSSITWFDIFFIGTMQALALIPGTSRSGITITAALLIGLSRTLAAKFAFLLAIPVIILSTLLVGVDLIKYNTVIDYQALIIAFGVAAIVAYLVIAFFMRIINTISLLPFVLYRIFLGIILLTII